MPPEDRIAPVVSAHVRIDLRVVDLLPKLGPDAFAVYVVLQRHQNRRTGRCDPSYETIAKETGTSRSTAIRCVRKLVKNGLTKKRSQWSSQGDRTSNQYNLGGVPVTPPPSQVVSERHYPPLEIVSQGHHPSVTGTPKPGISEHIYITKSEKQEHCPHPPSDIRTLPDYRFCGNCYLELELKTELETEETP